MVTLTFSFFPLFLPRRYLELLLLVSRQPVLYLCSKRAVFVFLATCDSCCGKFEEAIVFTATIIPPLPDRERCYKVSSPSSFLGQLAVIPFTSRSFRLCFPSPRLSWCFLLPYLIWPNFNLTVFLMSRQQYVPPPPYRTNPFATAEPIYETGPPITQPRRDRSSPYSPCAYLISFLP